MGTEGDEIEDLRVRITLDENESNDTFVSLRVGADGEEPSAVVVRGDTLWAWSDDRNWTNPSIGFEMMESLMPLEVYARLSSAVRADEPVRLRMAVDSWRVAAAPFQTLALKDPRHKEKRHLAEYGSVSIVRDHGRTEGAINTAPVEGQPRVLIAHYGGDDPAKDQWPDMFADDAARLATVLRGQGAIVEVTALTTPEALADAPGPYQIVNLWCHGECGPQLVMLDRNGKPKTYGPLALAPFLRRLGPTVVFIRACDSATPEPHALGGFAGELVRLGAAPCVIAMAKPVRKDGTNRLTFDVNECLVRAAGTGVPLDLGLLKADPSHTGSDWVAEWTATTVHFASDFDGRFQRFATPTPVASKGSDVVRPTEVPTVRLLQARRRIDDVSEAWALLTVDDDPVLLEVREGNVVASEARHRDDTRRLVPAGGGRPMLRVTPDGTALVCFSGERLEIAELTVTGDARAWPTISLDDTGLRMVAVRRSGPAVQLALVGEAGTALLRVDRGQRCRWTPFGSAALPVLIPAEADFVPPAKAAMDQSSPVGALLSLVPGAVRAVDLAVGGGVYLAACLSEGVGGVAMLDVLRADQLSSEHRRIAVDGAASEIRVGRTPDPRESPIDIAIRVDGRVDLWDWDALPALVPVLAS